MYRVVPKIFGYNQPGTSSTKLYTATQILNFDGQKNTSKHSFTQHKNNQWSFWSTSIKIQTSQNYLTDSIATRENPWIFLGVPVLSSPLH